MGIGGDGCAGEEIKGGPKQRWMDIIKDDLTEKGLSGKETQDWRDLSLVRNIDSILKTGKHADE